jgi:hypothetical protein
MKKISMIILIMLMSLLIFSSFKVSAMTQEEEDFYWQHVNEYWATRYNLPTYFYEETLYYKPGWPAVYTASNFKKMLVYQHRTYSGVLTIDHYVDTVVSPRVDFVPGVTISVSSGASATYSTSISATAGLELTLIKDILKASGSVTVTKSYSYTEFSEYSFVATYPLAVSLFGTDSGYTEFAILHKQGYGAYKSFNYEGEDFKPFATIFSSAENSISEWEYLGVGYFTSPLDGIEYTKMTLKGYY